MHKLYNIDIETTIFNEKRYVLIRKLFKQRLVYFLITIVPIGMIIFYGLFYSNPTVSYEPINEIHASSSSFLFKDTSADITTMDNQTLDQIILDKSSKNYKISVDDANKLTHMYVFRGRNNKAFTAVPTKELVSSEKRLQLGGWCMMNVFVLVTLTMFSISLNSCLPGSQIVFNKNDVTVTI